MQEMLVQVHAMTFGKLQNPWLAQKVYRITTVSLIMTSFELT